MERADCLPPNSFAYQWKRLTAAGDMAIPVRMASRAENKDDGEIGDLLQRVVAVNIR